MNFLEKITKDLDALHEAGYTVDIHLGRLLFKEVLDEVNSLTGSDDVSMQIKGCKVYFEGKAPFLYEFHARKEIDEN